MRSREVSEHKRLLGEFCDCDDLYRLLDLSHMIYRITDTDLCFGDYLRNMLSQHSQRLKESGKTDINKDGEIYV